MAKTFYTEQDIEELSKQGVSSLLIDDSVVLTDLARDKARRLDIALLTERDAKAKDSTYLAAQPSKNKSEKAASKGDNLEERVHAAVKSRLGEQVDNTLLRTIVQRVIKSIKNS